MISREAFPTLLGPSSAASPLVSLVLHLSDHFAPQLAPPARGSVPFVDATHLVLASQQRW